MVQKVYNPSEVSVIVSSFSNGVVKDIRPKVMSLLYQMNNTPVKFPVLESFDVDASVSSREMGIKKSTDTVEFQIKTYLQNRSSSERIPLLLGNTGLAKSAMIKSLASQYPHDPSKGIYGYRVIDLRCAFLDKLDLEGLVQKSADGKFTYNAPMASILTCTDDHL